MPVKEFSINLCCILSSSQDVNRNHYKVRVHELSAVGFLTKADHYEDYDFDTDEPLEAFAGRLAAKGFFNEKRQRWIMPGAIAWIERK